MDKIFHEKQQGSLCAQHCLNALLQGQFFSAVDLATIGHQMDEAERRHMEEAGSSEELEQFLQQPSNNVDDSGYFSVQVISQALSVWELDLMPFNSSDPRAVAARQDPTRESAFICHYRDHWLTIRKLGNQWFNLNSILPGPQLVSDTYLSLYLAQLQNDKYSIFIVVGKLPDCEADRHLLQYPLPAEMYRQQVQPSRVETIDEDDEQLKAVLELSRKEIDEDDEQESLNQAILLSLQSTQREVQSQASVDSTDEDLKKAIAMSLEACPSEPAPLESTASPPAAAQNPPEDLEFIRQRRLLRLGQLQP